MLLLRTEGLRTGPAWIYELKFDGFRAEAIKTGSEVHLRSRNDKDFNGHYPSIVRALATMREPPEFYVGLPALIQSVKTQGLEGLAVKRSDSPYEPGQHTAVTMRQDKEAGDSLALAGREVDQ